MDGRWLKTQFELNPNLSKGDLADYVGLKSPDISKILGNTRQVKAKEYILMREFFGLPTSDLKEKNASLSTHNARTSTPQNTLQDSISGVPSREEWMISDYRKAESIDQEKDSNQGKRFDVFEVLDSFMEPDFPKGSFVIADLTKGLSTKKEAYVIYDGYQHILRICALEHGKESFVSISALSKNFETQTIDGQYLQVIGKVAGNVNWLKADKQYS